MEHRPWLSARAGILIVFGVASLAILGAGALEARAMLTTTVHREAHQEAAREARLVAHLGLAAALSSRSDSRNELRLAAGEYDAARRYLPLAGIVLWTEAGTAVFSTGAGRTDARNRGFNGVARASSATGQTEVADGAEPGVGPTIDAAVPLRWHGLNVVAEFHFSRSAIEQPLNVGKRHLYALIVLAGVVLYIAILPLLARLAKTLPPPRDPAREAALREFEAALANRELEVHYQPLVEIQTGIVVGVEALVRWNHPQRGVLAPSAFLPIAESNVDLLARLTRQVFELAASDCARWRRDGQMLPISVNVPAPVLLDRPVVATIRETLNRHSLAANMLTLEVTESALMEREESVTQVLADVRALGVLVSIDDFGTGYSSLARLRSLPLGELKIDRSFISAIASDERDLGLARNVIRLGVDLGLRVVAEGVEDATTLQLLRDLGCSIAQGFHFSRPVPAEELQQWLWERERQSHLAFPPPAPSGARPAAARSA